MCNKRYKLNDDVTVEKGTPVFVNVMALHYDEEVFPEPEQWKPERMHNIVESDNMQCSLLPFGEGPRFCIGIWPFRFKLFIYILERSRYTYIE